MTAKQKLLKALVNYADFNKKFVKFRITLYFFLILLLPTIKPYLEAKIDLYYNNSKQDSIHIKIENQALHGAEAKNQVSYYEEIEDQDTHHVNIENTESDQDFKITNQDDSLDVSSQQEFENQDSYKDKLGNSDTHLVDIENQDSKTENQKDHDSNYEEIGKEGSCHEESNHHISNQNAYRAKFENPEWYHKEIENPLAYYLIQYSFHWTILVVSIFIALNASVCCDSVKNAIGQHFYRMVICELFQGFTRFMFYMDKLYNLSCQLRPEHWMIVTYDTITVSSCRNATDYNSSGCYHREMNIENATVTLNIEDVFLLPKEKCISYGFNWHSSFIPSEYTFMLLYSIFIIAEELFVYSHCWLKLPELIDQIETYRGLKNNDTKQIKTITKTLEHEDPRSTIFSDEISPDNIDLPRFDPESNALFTLSSDQFDTLRQRYKGYFTHVTSLFITLVIMDVVWNVCFVYVSIFHYSISEQLVSWLVVIMIWIATYKCWFPTPKVLPTAPHIGLLYDEKEDSDNEMFF